MSTLDNSMLREYDLLYNRAPCGLLAFEIEGEIVHFNQTLLEWLNIDKSELMELKFTDLLEKGGKLYYQIYVLPLLRMQKVVKEISFEIAISDVRFSCLFSATIIPSAICDKKIVNAVVFKVVDRKKYEDELLNKKTKADEENQRNNEALRLIAFAQSHLVRAPLANILGLVSLYEELEISDELRSLNQMLKNSAQQLDIEIRNIVNQADNNH